MNFLVRILTRNAWEVFFLLILVSALGMIFSQGNLHAKEANEVAKKEILIESDNFLEIKGYDTLGQVWFGQRISGIKNQNSWQFISKNLAKPVLVRGITSFVDSKNFGFFRSFDGLVIKVFDDEKSYLNFDQSKTASRPPYFGEGEIALIEIVYQKEEKIFQLGKLYILREDKRIEDLNNQRIFLGSDLWRE